VTGKELRTSRAANLWPPKLGDLKFSSTHRNWKSIRVGCARGNMITTLMSEIDPDAPMTVLIVEDEVLIRLDSADRLRAEGYTVIEASNVTKLSSSFSNLS